jgi:hypothetical protein
MAYDKIMKKLTPNKIRPQTSFEGSQIHDESTNYEVFEHRWRNANKVSGSRGTRGGPGLKK